MRALGIDIGGTSVKGALIEQSSEGRESERLTRSATYSKCDASTLRSATQEVFEVLGNPDDCHIGLCLPGASRAGVMAHSVNLPALTGFDVPQMLRELSPSLRSLWLLTDAYAGAFDVYHRMRGRDQDQERLAAISIGTGVGLSVLDGGAPLDLGGGTSGRIGQLDVSLEADAPVGADGGRGSLEAYIGVPALRARFGDRTLSDNPKLLLALRRDDTPIRALARAIRIVHAIYRPKRVFLLGGVGLVLGGARPQLDAMIRDRLTSVADPDWTLEFGETVHHAALGAARFAMGAGGT